MHEQAAIHLALDLRRGSSPIEGVVRFDDVPPMAFVGWMPLLSILEAAHAGRLPALCDDPTSGTDKDPTR